MSTGKTPAQPVFISAQPIVYLSYIPLYQYTLIEQSDIVLKQLECFDYVIQTYEAWLLYSTYDHDTE